ncbi:prostaglandin-E(2) 9-reductase [Oryctolagus cuniculus]|uniref:prostaglandin-E(2) 9-reductase n=1 Tax=Oryctolagus cuniculus TaxID=9986 RepID=UPI0038798A09
MDPKFQRVALSDGHFIPILEFGTYAPVKLWCIFHRPELVRPSLEDSLKKLQLDYVDLYIIHFPTALKPGEEIIPTDEHGKTIFDTVDICATWEAMEKCKDAGLAKSIGVSSFNHRQPEMILDKPGLKYKPVYNQVRTLSLFSICYYPLLILLPRV